MIGFSLSIHVVGRLVLDDPVVFLYADEHMIEIEYTLEGHTIYMTFIYGDPVINTRDLVWERLIQITPEPHLVYDW